MPLKTHRCFVLMNRQKLTIPLCPTTYKSLCSTLVRSNEREEVAVEYSTGLLFA